LQQNENNSTIKKGQDKRLKKLTTLGREDVFLVHPQNGFNSFILNCALVATGSLQPKLKNLE
jgi:hypothetical protein